MLEQVEPALPTDQVANLDEPHGVIRGHVIEDAAIDRGSASAITAASHSTGIQTFGFAPDCSLSAAWPEVELRSDMLLIADELALWPLRINYGEHATRFINAVSRARGID